MGSSPNASPNAPEVNHEGLSSRSKQTEPPTAHPQGTAGPAPNENRKRLEHSMNLVFCSAKSNFITAFSTKRTTKTV